MKAILTTTWKARKETIKNILEDREKYKYSLFIENVMEDPWPYNEEWFEEQRGNKKLFVLTNEESDMEII
ncbi:MAG: hypothetical protein KAS32_30970 [Candidatus Peribacteraceae bacterium]|nr:hypothetical protein [Candidatus Peribacteraceae bacterium]